MAFSLTSTQKTDLQTLRDTFPDTNSPSYSQSLNYYEMYELLLSYIEDYEAAGNTLTDEEQITKIWLEGVIDVNKGQGAQSDFIRDYNSAQNELRYDDAISPAGLDKASDDIAIRVIDEVLERDVLPDIEQLAAVDVAEVSTQLLNNDAAAWAGNPLLLFLGYSAAFNDNIIGDGSDTYDLLAMMKIGYETIGGYTALFDPSNISLFYGAVSTAIQADAEQALTNAYTAADQLLQSNYDGLPLLAAGLEVAFGDVILGSVGNDSAVGGSTFEFLGYTYNEIIHAGDGDDTLIGGSGSDIFDGGNGTDTISFAAASEAVAINLNTGRTVVGNELRDYLYHIENTTGSAYNDTLFGNADANVLNGGGGNDYLEGNSGTDTIVFSGSFGSDTVTGGEVVIVDGDTLDGSESGVLFDADGSGLLIAKSGNTITLTDWATDGDYGISVAGGGGVGQQIGGTVGNDVLQGTSGNDTISGGFGGNDLLQVAANDNHQMPRLARAG